MRTLVLTQVVPNPPDAGPKIKTHYVLRTLAREHAVELVTFARSPAEVEAAMRLHAWCERVTVVNLRRHRVMEPYYLVRGWMGRTPYLVARDARRALGRIVRDRLASGAIDVLHADQLSMAQYLRTAQRTVTATVFDAHNAVWELVRDLASRQPTPAHRLAAEIEWRFLRRFEGCVCRSSDLTLAVSFHDRDVLAAAAGAPIRTAVIPIGVEVQDVPFMPPRPDASGILSAATMLYPPNAEAIRWFCDEIWPLVRQRSGRATVDIAGPRPPADIVDWGQTDPRVLVHGFVESLDDLYGGAAAFIVPLRSGSGVRVKILDAMARGVPVVSTSIGASGLELAPGKHLLIADTPAEFAQAIIDLLGSPEYRVRLAAAARARVLERYDWRTCCRPLLDAYRALDRGSLTAARSAPALAHRE